MSIQLTNIRKIQSLMDNKKLSSLELTQYVLENIKNTQGEGSKSFTKVYEEQAIASAKASDMLRHVGLKRSLIEGIPISIKDLFDYKGDITKSGSIALNNAKPAQKTALIIQRLIDSGAIIIGRTNMTEFAFSGLGLNPHYGTPASPWNRANRHIAGGSSCGAAVSVSDNMAIAAIGSDTGGSIRIPAAFCKLTGFKPSAYRIPAIGSMPLSHNLDSFGPIAKSVDCCHILDTILAGEYQQTLRKLNISSLRLLVPTNYVWNDADKEVIEVFYKKLDILKSLGIQIDIKTIPELEEISHITRLGGFVCADAWFYHQSLIGEKGEYYDPRVKSRIIYGKMQSAADYIELLNARKDWINRMQLVLEPYDALIMPTVPILPPTIKLLEEDEDSYIKYNRLVLRNPTIINYLDGCAFSLPCQNGENLPIGFMLASTNGQDSHLFNIAYTIEEFL